MGTITINVDDHVERKFRDVAGAIYSKRKGYLGKAITEAMQHWIYEKKQRKIAKKALKLMEQGFDSGGRLYKTRGDLHER